MNNEKTCRWGILSTAVIARKNWRAIAKSARGTVVAVASRRLESARRFIDECQAHTPQVSQPIALGSYEELLKREDIDAVYIPLPTGLRKEWLIAAARHGKHILAEKPTAISAEDLEEVLTECERNRVQFMDGVMFMHSQRMAKLKTALEDQNSFGSLRRIACQFSFLGDEEFGRANIRSKSDLEPFGCLGDLGWYCIRFILWANQWQMPTHMRANCIQRYMNADGSDGVPSEFSAELSFASGATGSFYCSFRTGNQQWAHVSGTKGNLFVRDFVVPHFGSQVTFETEQTAFVIEGCDFHMQERTDKIAVEEYGSGFAPAQEIRMIDAMNDMVLSKKRDPFWGKIALSTQTVMDKLMRIAD
jgi:predicted dehydrogenase